MIAERISGRAQYYWLAGILVIAAALRIVGANAPLWFDELVTVHTHLRLPWSQMMTEFEMNHHYLFSLQSKLAIGIWGEAPWAVRLPSLVFGTAIVAAIWVQARDILGARLAHVTALLVAMSYHQVWFSQNARGYAELAFWCILGLWAFLRALSSERLNWWLLFGLCLAAAGFTHLTGTTFFLALGVIWLFEMARRALAKEVELAHLTGPLIGAGLGIVVLAALYFPMIPSMLNTVGGVSSTSAVDVMQEYQNPIWTVIEGIQTALGRSGGLTLVLAIAVLVVTLAGAVKCHAIAPYFAWAIFLHIALTVGLLLALNMRIWPRFFFVDIALVMVLIVAGVAQISTWIGAVLGRALLGEWLFRAGVVAMVLLSVALLSKNYSAPKQDLNAAVAWVDSNDAEGARVYSLGPGGALFRPYLGTDWGEILTSDAYRAALEDDGPVLLVVPFPARVHRVIPELVADRDTTLDLVHVIRGTLGDGNILIFKRPG